MKISIVIFCLISTSLSWSKSNKRFTKLTSTWTADTSNELFEGIARLSGCSASLVKFKNQSAKAKAMILTNDHCLDDQAYNTYTFNQPYEKTIRIFDKNKKLISKTFISQRLIYATQTDTDFGLLELEETYAELERKYDVTPLELSDETAIINDEITLITGYFAVVIECQIDAFVYKLIEDTWTWTNSYRYRNCQAGHGTSGSPLILKGTRSVVGIHNTGNDHGGKCTLNNPCEVDAKGKITAVQGRVYGQQTTAIYSCLNDNIEFDIKTPGCKLLGGDSWVKVK